MEWDIEMICDRFQHEAENTNRYLNEVQTKAKSNFSYQQIYDEYLAKYYLYNYLHGRTFLGSQESLLLELDKLVDNPPKDVGAYDSGRFEDYYQQYIGGLIEEFSAGKT